MKAAAKWIMETVGKFFKRLKKEGKQGPKFFYSDTKMDLTKLKMVRPVADVYPISSPFGVKRTIKGKTGIHNGIDFACPIETPVIAMCDGEAYRVGWENPKDKSQGFGLRIWQIATIEKEVFFIWYGHLSKIFIDEPLKPIKAGEIIGLSGNSGSSTGPHLHVGIRKRDTSIFYDMDFV